MRRFAKPLYGLNTCTQGSNPCLSATQSGLQRSSAHSAPKYANNARISRLFLDKPDYRERTARQRRPSRPGFSPGGTHAVRLWGGQKANLKDRRSRIVIEG